MTDQEVGQNFYTPAPVVVNFPKLLSDYKLHDTHKKVKLVLIVSGNFAKKCVAEHLNGTTYLANEYKFKMCITKNRSNFSQR
jgi:hypothetical protein